MKINRVLPLFIVSAILIFAVWVIAQEGEEMSPEQQKMMELMKKYGTPGEHHKLLDQFVGEWDIASKWWESPDAPVDESQATSKIEWIMDGRYLMESVEGMLDEGMPFKGMGITGYDIYGEKFNSFWIDNWSTMFFIQYGTCNEDGSMFTLEGTYDDYISGRKDKLSKSIIRVTDKDTRVMTMYDQTPDGEEYMSMEMTYTRKK